MKKNLKILILIIFLFIIIYFFINNKNKKIYADVGSSNEADIQLMARAINRRGKRRKL